MTNNNKNVIHIEFFPSVSMNSSSNKIHREYGRLGLITIIRINPKSYFHKVNLIRSI